MAYSTTSDISELLRQTTLEGNVEEVGGAELGRGAYGRVFTVIYSGSIYAAKEIHPILYEEVGVEEKEAVRRNFLRECYYCSTFSHPNIVQFIGIHYPPHKPLHLPIMIMEMMNNSLTSLMRSKPNLDIKVKNSILLDVTCGLHYLHSRSPPVIHRDLSPNNIMLSSQLMAKIGDLGVAKAIRADSRRTKNKLTSAPGTTDFMPPEALHDNAVYDTSLDVFSFGGIMIYVITEEWPTPKASTKFDMNTRCTIGFNEVERRQHYLDKITGNYALKSLIERCLDNDPNVRPSIPAIIKALKFIDIAATNSPAAYKNHKTEIQFLPYNSYSRKTLPVNHSCQNMQTPGKRSYSVTSGIRPTIPPRPSINITTNKVANGASAIHKVHKMTEAQSFSHNSKSLPVLVPHNFQNMQQTGKRSFSLGNHSPSAIPPKVHHRPIPLSTLQSGKCHIKWTKCADLPCKMRSISIVADAERKKIYASTNDSIIPCCVFCYELVLHRWMHLPKLKHYHFVLLMCNGQLHAIGGYDSKSHKLTKTISTFCEATKNWASTYPDLLKARLKPGAISYQDHMIVAGGYVDKIHIADDIEILNSTQQPFIWKSCTIRLPLQMWAVKFAICEKNLYIVGYNDCKHTKADAFRIPANALISSPNASSKLCANTPNWLVLPPAPYFRAGLASTSILLMVAGGSSTSSMLSSDVFRFDRFNNEWKMIGSLASPKADAAMCTINNTIVVIGGYSRGGGMEASEESSLSTMEIGQVEVN